MPRTSYPPLAARDVPMVDSYAGNSPDTRLTDPVTSHEARDSSNAAVSLGAVLRALTEEGPMTDEGLVGNMIFDAALGIVPLFTPQRIRTARHALVERGLVEFAGFYRLTATGRRARVWDAVVS